MGKKDIVVVGASYSGILIAHNIIKHVIPKFPDHRLILINPSTDLYNVVAGPRIIIDGKLLTDDKVFLSIADGFKQYPASSYEFIQASVTSIDPSTRNLQYTHNNGEERDLNYHALILATGSNTFTPLWNANPTTDEARNAIHKFREALPNARSIVIGGGGPAAVETAGEIAEFLNGTAGWFSSRPSNPKAAVTVVTSAPKLLPLLRESVAKQAEKYLGYVGASVVYNTKVVATEPAYAGQSYDTLVPKPGQKVQVQLSDGQIISADIFIPAFGKHPNPTYAPSYLVDANTHKIKTDNKTLRVTDAGPRVYTVGDVSSASPGGAMALQAMVPVVITNLKRDLRAAESGKEIPDTGRDREYEAPPVDHAKSSQIVPVGRGKGVGQLFGWKVPSFLVWFIKGRDYFSGMTQDKYVMGGAAAKEDVWKFEI